MNYICKNRHGIYYARCVIPMSLRGNFKNKREIRYSLKTDSRKQAIISCGRKRVEFDEIIESMQETITWEMIEDYTEIAKALPKNFNHTGHTDKFKGITLDMLLDCDADDYELRKPSAIKSDF